MKLLKTVSTVLVSLSASLTFASSGNYHSDIVGGSDAARGEFPFIVSLQNRSSGHFCGGSLIRKNWVLTAAHCVAGNIQTVVIGLHDRNDTRNTESIKPRRIIPHPQYDENSTDYDYALIELSQDSQFEPIAMNMADILVPSSGPSIMATVAGWGLTRESSYALPNRLQKVTVPLVDRESCNKSYPNSITDRMICAGLPQGGKDSCQGDSGGPLIATALDMKSYLIGVVSWGAGCARPGQPGIYSNVGIAASWIGQTIQ